MITTNVGTRGATTFFVTSEDPAGPWSEPIRVEVPGIDPDLAWDADGNCWVHFSGLGGIARCRIDPATGGAPRGSRPDVVRDRPAVPRGAAPLRARRHLVPPDRRRRDPRRPLRVRRPGALARRAVGGRTRQPDPQPPQHGPPDSEHRARATWWRRRTGRGGWSCSACDPRGCPPASTSSAARPSSSRCGGWTAGPCPASSPWRWMPSAPGPPQRSRRHGADRDDFDAPALGTALGRRPPAPGVASARWQRARAGSSCRRCGDARLGRTDLRRPPPAAPPLPGQGPRRRRRPPSEAGLSSCWTRPRTTTSLSTATASSRGPASGPLDVVLGDAPRPGGPRGPDR